MLAGGTRDGFYGEVVSIVDPDQPDLIYILGYGLTQMDLIGLGHNSGPDSTFK